MAAALAKRRWPCCKIQSVGFAVLSEGRGAAREAATAMHSRGIDISDHKTTSIGKVDIQGFDYIVVVERAVLDFLRKKDIDLSKVKEACVDDPFGGDARRYEDCARAIEGKLDALVL